MIQRRHAEIFLALAKQAETELWGPEAEQWLDRLEREHEHFRTAMRWSLGRGDAATALRISSALTRFWQLRGHAAEGLEWLEAALASEGGVPAPLRARALTSAGNLAVDKGDASQAREYFEQALELWRGLGERGSMAVTLDALAALARDRGDHESARELYQETLAVFRVLGDKPAVAASLNNLATIFSHLGDHEEARTLYEESLTLFEELEDERGVATAIVNIGMLMARAQGDFEQAMALATEGLDMFAKQGAKEEIADCLAELGEVARAQDKLQEASRFFGTAETLRGMQGQTPPATDYQQFNQRIASRHPNQDLTMLYAAWAEGRATAVQLAEAYGWGEHSEESSAEA